MRRYDIKTLAALLVSGLLGLTACTEVESIAIDEVNAETSDGRYAQYLDNLKAYKEAGHQVVYGWFDNSQKTPSSQGQHITSVPDSMDVVVLTTPELADFERDDIRAVRQKGTRVAALVSYDRVKAAYDELASDPATAPAEDFETYLLARVDETLALTDDYDGLVVEFAGQDPDYLREPDRSAYVALQAAFLDRIAAWQTAHAGKTLSFAGKPQNLDDKTLLQGCEHIILDGTSAVTAAQLSLLARAAAEEGVPADRFVMAAALPSMDSSDTEAGYWGSGVRALGETAYWATVEESGYAKAGIAVYDLQNDYYETNGFYTYVREAINIINPAPAN